MGLAQTAKQLGMNKEIMDSYWEYHERKQNWFFSPNPNLDGATRRPIFPTANDWKKYTPAQRKQKWNNLSLRQRMTISSLAGFGYEGKSINLDSMNHFSKLREACMSKWKENLYSIFWSDLGDGKRWLCNVFVGDAIYLHNGSNFASSNNHYYDPKQIYKGQSVLKKRESYKDVKEGDIVVFGTTHVEIVTSIQKNSFVDDGFCSIGAGRGMSREQVGSIKCDSDWGWSLPYLGGARELKDDNNTYFYL